MTNRQRPKTVNVRPATYRKLQKIKAARRWSYGDFVDMAADRELAVIASEARRTAASSDQPALAGLPQ